MIHITPELLRTNPLPMPEEGDKDARGRVLIVGGSLEVPGGALLAAEAALRTGAGKLKIATCRSIAPQMGLAMPEALVMGLDETGAGGIAPDAADGIVETARKVDAVLIGPGMMDPEATDPLTASVLSRLRVPAVLDAGALRCMPRLADTLRRSGAARIITPHPGEMAQLLDREREEIEADPQEAGRQAASKLHCIVVMKGAQTHIVDPEGGTWLFTGGTVGLATSGSGDTLAGMIVALLARGAPPVWAAIWGVFLHGGAGTRLFRRYGGIGFLAREIPGEVPHVMAEFASQAD